MKCQCIIHGDPFLPSEHRFDCRLYKAYERLEIALRKGDKQLEDKILNDIFKK